MIKPMIAFTIAVIAIAISFIWIWRHVGWKITSAIFISFCLIDLDHFIFTNQPGFVQAPSEGARIFHAFHTVEFLLIVMMINLIIGKRVSNWKAWIFPQHKDYSKNWHYYLSWTSRILMLGMAIHYFMDFFIYTIMGTWGYYDFSVIHYLLIS
jgi:hypothetical protein